MWKLGIVNAFAAVMAITCAPALGQEVEAPDSYSTKEDICNGIESEDRIKIGVKPGTNQDALRSQDEEHTLTGTITSCGDGVLIIKAQESGAKLVQVYLEDVKWLKVSQGKSNHTQHGAGIGLFAGLIVGFSTMSDDDLSDEYFDIEQEVQNTGWVLGSAVVGLVVGAVVGSFIGSEKWDLVYENSSLSFLGNDSTGEFQVAFGYSF
jgi:hypothetical protein